MGEQIARMQSDRTAGKKQGENIIMKALKKIVACVGVVAMLLATSACTAEKKLSIATAADLDGLVIGVQLGTTGDTIATDKVKAKSVSRLKSYVDVITSLQKKKVDCVVMDRDTANAYVAKNDDLTIIDVGFDPEQYAIGVQKGDPNQIMAAINTVIADMKADGSLEASFTAHKGADGPVADLNVGAAGGKLIMGTNATFEPYEYTKGTEDICGVDIDMMAKVAKSLDMELEIVNMEFDGLITACQQGKIMVIASGMTITEDRQVNVDFSDTYVDASQVVVVRKASVN